jgi:NAD(P)H-hydrate epimerase
VYAVLREVHQPVVLDADALNVLAGDLGPLASRSDTTVITPHPAELARLLATQTSAVQADRVEAAREAARRAGCVVVLKGFRSIVAAPDGTIVVNPTGSSELATAGTGDVLTGALTTLLAAGCDPLVAASTAAYVHGLAGELAAIDRGSGVVAWDVAESLASAVANLRTGS